MTAMIKKSRDKHDEPVAETVNTRSDWRAFARCQSEPETFVIVEGPNGTEPPYPTPEQAACCARCPVRTDCLNFALTGREPAGVWGGMSAYQRELLHKVQSRKSCPGCSSKDIVVEGNQSRQHEVCLSCGVSWSA